MLLEPRQLKDRVQQVPTHSHVLINAPQLGPEFPVFRKRVQPIIPVEQFHVRCSQLVSTKCATKVGLTQVIILGSKAPEIYAVLPCRPASMTWFLYSLVTTT